MADCTARAISGVSCAMTSDTRRAASSELLLVVVAGPTLLREPWLNPAEVRGQQACGTIWTIHCHAVSVYIPSTLLLSTPKPSCPDDKEDVESNLFPEAEDSEEKLCWLETEAVEAVEAEEADEAPTAAWTAWATWGWMASRICCTRLPLAREAWEEKEESWEAVRDEEDEEELKEEEEDEEELK